MEYKDYYKIMGVERNADAEAIKKAFRKLARQYHPDANPGDKTAEEKFKELNEANEVLSDPEKRRLYDQLGSNYESYRRGGGDPRQYNWGQWAGNPSGNSNPFTGRGRRGGNVFEDEEFSDFFSSIFGSMGGRQAQPRTRDIEQAVELSFDEAYHGTTRILTRPGQSDIEVKIPAGVKTGSKVRVKGHGVSNNMGNAGDLFLVVQVKDHPIYERKDDDLYRDVHVSVFKALLGGEQTIETLNGNFMVKIPAGTSSGRLIRMKGKGMPKLGAKGESGDLYLRIMLDVPAADALTPEERAALETMAQRFE